jgi:hypothetical protein
MGYMGCWADVIEEEEVGKICPKEYKEFVESLANEEFSMKEMAIKIQNENAVDKLYILVQYEMLTKAFKNKTGLNLEIAHHDSEIEGDCYDRVDGVYWCVGNV